MSFTANHSRNASLGVGILLLSPTAAHADAGIPMLPFAYPVIIVFLLPVIAIEALYIRLRLHIGWRNTIGATAKANLITLLIGFPLSWLIFFIAEVVFYLALIFLGIENHIRWTLDSRLTDFLIVVTSAAWMGPVEVKWPFPLRTSHSSFHHFSFLDMWNRGYWIGGAG